MMVRDIDSAHLVNCEPTLSELLADPIFQLLMERDRVVLRDLTRLLTAIREIDDSPCSSPAIGMLPA